MVTPACEESLKIRKCNFHSLCTCQIQIDMYITSLDLKTILVGKMTPPVGNVWPSRILETPVPVFHCWISIRWKSQSKMWLWKPYSICPFLFTPIESRSWFFSDPLLTNKLASMVESICEEASYSGNFTNHSLRATGTTTLFDARVPEAVIWKWTEHKCHCS